MNVAGDTLSSYGRQPMRGTSRVLQEVTWFWPSIIISPVNQLNKMAVYRIQVQPF